MSELKRKREEDDPEEEPGVTDAVPVASPRVAPVPPTAVAAVQPAAAAAAAPRESTASEGGKSDEAGPATDTAVAPDGTGPPAISAEKAAAGATSEGTRRGKSKPPTTAGKITICGKEITLQHTGGRKKRKHPMETLILLAYKEELTLKCKANNMISALEIHQEMKSKGIKQDLSTHMMVLSLCGGSPGDRDELDPGNGSTGGHAASVERTAAAVAKGRVEGASAQDNTFAAAEAALQIFSDASKGGTVSLPESAYTAVIRACCRDGRADRAREALEALKQAGLKPRVRTYTPLLEAYSKLDGRLEDCMALWREAVSPPGGLQQGITMTEREYLHLIAACTRARDEKCFLEVMTEYMDDVLQPRSRHSWDVLKSWFKVGPNVIGNGYVKHREVAAATTARTKPEEGEIENPRSGELPDNGGISEGDGGESGQESTATSGAAAAAPTLAGDAAGAPGVGDSAPSLSKAVVATEPPSARPDGSHGTDSALAPASSSPSPAPAPQADGSSGDDATGAAATSPRAAGAYAVGRSFQADGCGGDDAMEDAPQADGDEAVGGPTPVAGEDAVEEASPRADAAGGEKEPPSGGTSGWIVTECYVRKDGTCENCGEVMRSIELSEDDEQRLLKQIEELVCTNEQRTHQWEGFRGWLERRGKQRYNVIIDGANVGYYKACLSEGELADLRQVDWAVKKFQDEGKKPLVVLHSRHLVEKRLSDEAKEIYKRWKEADMIQSCAPKNNDDWYWLYAAVYTGGSVLVLTNDEMRDHHFSMLSHRSFQRWKERHQARFYFGDWKGEGGDDDEREVITEEPRSYSKRTQKGVDSWHVPLERSRDWLCARWQPQQQR
ncbi:unnamed protein product [Ectocarpus sp. CCAP 1310/34]|nr:unnamed protein product [Ectocarpus sp. CCAP 1310/34]